MSEYMQIDKQRMKDIMRMILSAEQENIKTHEKNDRQMSDEIYKILSREVSQITKGEK